MFNKKYIILYLILLFLLTRLYLLFAGLESLLAPSPYTNELYPGTTAKMYMDGSIRSINSLFDYQLLDHNGISTFVSLAAIPFIYVFGPYLFSVKLVALAFFLATMVLWFLFVKRHISTGTAVITALLFIFAPPSFISYNLSIGFHSVPLFFDILALTFFFEMIRNTPLNPLFLHTPFSPLNRGEGMGVCPLLVQSSSIEPNISVQATSLNQPKVWWYTLFGVVSGFSLWVDNVFAITLATCVVFWFIHDKLFFLKKTFAIFVISFFAGFSVWFYYVIYIRHFQIMNIFEYSSYYPKSIFHKKFLETLAYKLPYSLCFKDYFFSGVCLNYLYYAVFVMAFLGLIWYQRKTILKMLSSFLPTGRQRTLRSLSQGEINEVEPRCLPYDAETGRQRTLCSLIQRGETSLSTMVAQCSQIITVESFFLGYIVIFILAFSLSRLDVGFKSKDFWDYRLFPPLYPFIFVTIAMGLNKLLNTCRGRFQTCPYLLIFVLISTGIIGLASQTNIRDFGKGLTFKGYSYKALAVTVKLDHNEIVKRANQVDEGLYKNHLYQHWGFMLALGKMELSACETLIRDVEETLRPNCYEGFGYGYGVIYSDASTVLEKLRLTNLTDKCYEKYFLYGIASSLSIQETVDKHTFMIAQIDFQFQPYFYQGLGIQLARRMSHADTDGILLQIDEINKKYCCIGIGQDSARRLEWAFADKEYPISFDGLNKDYWHDCYYGLGWGIGDFFEFDIERYLAVINNNVSPEYMEHCLRGLADRLHWKFGGDAKKFQTVTELFPEPYKTSNRKRLLCLLLLGNYDTPSPALGIYVSGNTAYVANGGSGLQIIDISNPTAPKLLGSYDTTGGAFNVYVSGSTAYVADWDKGLQIIDVSNPTAPALLGSYDTPGGTLDDYVAGSKHPPLPTQPPWAGGLDVCVSGNTAYVADGYGGLQIIDVSNPAAPILLGSYDTPGEALHVYVSGSTAYVADFDSGLQIIDVSNPTAPTLLGIYDTPGEAWDVYVSGNMAYVADGESGLQIIDVSNPTAPALLGSYDTPSKAFGLYVSGSTAYVADRFDGLLEIDISNPISPTLLWSYDTPYQALHVYVSGSTAYVADWKGGLQIIDVSVAEQEYLP